MGQVDGLIRLAVQSDLAHVAYDPDDLEPRFVFALQTELDTLAYWVRAREAQSCERLTDERARGVLIGEEAAALQGDLEDAEVVG